MEPQSDKVPGLGLPQPSTEQGSAGLDGYKVGYIAPEMSAGGSEVMPGPGAVPMQAPPLPQQPMTAGAHLDALNAPAQLAAAPPSDADEERDDLDEEWVNKAKSIVDRTKSDPYVETKELSKAKADYLRIRYNKQIKVAEDKQ